MRELKPKSIEDIIAGIALYRPGPMDFIPKYIAGKNDEDLGWHIHADDYMSDELQVIREGEIIRYSPGLCMNKGENREILASKARNWQKVKTPDGRELAKEKKFDISGTTETLVYALPSSDTMYLEGGDKWFVECYVSASCLVAMEVKDSEGNIVYTRD